MHYTRDYTNSPTKAFDAVQDIIDYLGKTKYDKIAPWMARVSHCGNFAMFCALAGIQGYPVIAWYEHFHGQDSWKPEQLEYLK